jgi:hypothetical protein
MSIELKSTASNWPASNREPAGPDRAHGRSARGATGRGSSRGRYLVGALGRTARGSCRRRTSRVRRNVITR